MKNKFQVETKLLELLLFEKENGNRSLKWSRMSPRRQGKIQALRWVLDQSEMREKKAEEKFKLKRIIKNETVE